MKTIAIHSKGGPERLVLEESEEPRAAPGTVLVEVAAAGVNFIDIYQREGIYPVTYPFVPGIEGAGVVIGLGEGVEHLSVGDRISWTNVVGSYRERHVVTQDQAVPIPDQFDLETAAALLLQGLTAHYLATDTYRLVKGSRCLVHAGAGGVGLLLTQIAKLRGATVITTVGSEEKAELSRQAGADLVINYREVDFQEAIESEYRPHALDVVYDGVGADTFMQGLDLLRPRGMMVTFGNASGVVPEISPLILGNKGSLFLTRPSLGHYIATREELLARADDLFGWVTEGRLEVRVGGRYPLADAAKAQQDLAARRTTGKLLILP